jgi:nucleoid-associated protein YgaU
VAKLTFQRLDLSKNAVGSPLEVPYNPTEYAMSKAAQFTEIAIPGLDAPVLQFVRGDAETLGLELFFDATDQRGTGTVVPGLAPADDPMILADRLYRLVKIEGDLHTPPLVRVTWGNHFPGPTLGQDQRPVPSFDCVVTSVDRRFTLFNADGVPLRAIVTLQLREYKTLEEQLRELNLMSADHTRVHVVRRGEDLPLIAYDAYGDPARWTLIADHNDLADVRDLVPGTILQIPPVP